MKQFFSETKWMFLIAAVIVAFDQLTKWLIRSNLAFGESWAPWDWLMPYARLVYWKNTGVAFGMLQGMNFVFIILAAIVSIALIVYFPSVPRRDWLIRLALSMELGGAVGNLLDRIQFGHVIDFISIGNFPVWNVADACITVGVFILLLGIYFQDRRDKREARLAEDNAPVNPGEGTD